MKMTLADVTRHPGSYLVALKGLTAPNSYLWHGLIADLPIVDD